MNVSALTVARSLKAEDVLAALDRAVTERGVPGNIRSDNGPEFISKVTRQYLTGERNQNALHRTGQSMAKSLRGKLP